MKLPHLSKFWHGAAHVGLMGLQGANIVTHFLPPPWNLVAGVGLAGVQGALAMHQHTASPNVFTMLNIPPAKD